MRTADQPIRISLFAPNGRMGQAIAAAAADDPHFAIDQDHGDVLVDFSSPEARPVANAAITIASPKSPMAHLSCMRISSRGE